jgi:hypothetical protein
MRWLLRLYPRGWRDRYGDELMELIDKLHSDQSRARMAWDVGRGAIDAHLTGRYGMRRLWSDPALRRGVFDGLVLAAFSAVIILVTNVIVPPDPAASDADVSNVVGYLALLVAIGLLFVAVGARGRLRAAGLGAGARAGAVAGAVLAVAVTLTFIVVNNVFLGTVSQQYDKRINFAASGWTSMRAYLTVEQLRSALILVPVTAAAGAVAGLVGALLVQYWRRRRPQGLQA